MIVLAATRQRKKKREKIFDFDFGPPLLSPPSSFSPSPPLLPFLLPFPLLFLLRSPSSPPFLPLPFFSKANHTYKKPAGSGWFVIAVVGFTRRLHRASQSSRSTCMFNDYVLGLSV